MFAGRSTALVNRTHRIGPKTFVSFREIAADSGGSTSCDTQSNCGTSFTIAVALLSPPFFGLLFVPQPSREEMSTLCRIYM